MFREIIRSVRVWSVLKWSLERVGMVLVRSGFKMVIRGFGIFFV